MFEAVEIAKIDKDGLHEFLFCQEIYNTEKLLSTILGRVELGHFNCQRHQMDL